MNFKVDLHTHSLASHDGGIMATQYKRVIDAGVLDCIAITDHNRIDFALQVRQEMGECIIVGEEIMTTAGEIIGLYLAEVIKPGLTPLETVKQIKDKGGIVYIPHPFETVRKGLHPGVLEELADYIDIIEVCNGRAFFQNRSAQAVVWAKMNHKLAAASSDAHGYKGLGKTFTSLEEMPSAETLLGLFTNATPITDRPAIRTLLYPKYNKLRRKLGRQSWI
jgi:predicted metal-dependent phosphoesterase TrpH